MLFLATVHQFVNVGHQKFTVGIVNTMVFKNTAFVCLCVHMCAWMQSPWWVMEVRGQLVLVSSIPSVGPEHRTRVVKLGCKRLHPLSRLTGPTVIGFRDAVDNFF